MCFLSAIIDQSKKTQLDLDKGHYAGARIPKGGYSPRREHQTSPSWWYKKQTGGAVQGLRVSALQVNRCSMQQKRDPPGYGTNCPGGRKKKPFSNNVEVRGG